MENDIAFTCHRLASLHLGIYSQISGFQIVKFLNWHGLVPRTLIFLNKFKKEPLPNLMLPYFVSRYLVKGPAGDPVLGGSANFNHEKAFSFHMNIAQGPLGFIVISLLFDVCDCKGVNRNSFQY